MKALFSKFARKSHNEIKDREKIPPLPQWPPVPPKPTQEQQQPPSTLPQLPQLVEEPPLAIHTVDLQRPTSSPAPAPSATTTTAPRVRTRRSSKAPPPTDAFNTDSVASLSAPAPDKKVAFLSPPPTPTPNPSQSPQPNSSVPALRVSKDQPIVQPTARSTTSTSSHHPRVMSPGLTPRYDSSVRSGTPYSQSANSSRILAPPSWSEAAEEDLVSNLGPRERTRQEVLWEIVASEERYVAELIKMKETFIDPLLHPYALASAFAVSSPASEDEVESYHRGMGTTSPTESLDNLPIAARFLSPTGFEAQANYKSGESSDDEQADKIGKGYSSSASGHDYNTGTSRSPYRANEPQSAKGISSYSHLATGRRTIDGRAVPFPSRSHQSLPPPPKIDPRAASSASLGRQNVLSSEFLNRDRESQRRSSATPSSRVFRKLRKSTSSTTAAAQAQAANAAKALLPGAVPPHVLPEEFRKCLEVIESGIIQGHMTLSESLRKRYDEQYPLVRSLADVFVANSHILHQYATYVLHLERALEQVDNALSTATNPDVQRGKNKKQQEQEWIKISKYIYRLEETAGEKAQTGLAISLSKPFQRLLKYPLLFQNLLFHTDPSTYEYESTLQMVAEVETIVRSIEDEKIQKEERDKTRDAFARIDGLEKVRDLALPKSSRLLVEEKQLGAETSKGGKDSSSSLSPTPKTAVKGKSSLKRFSDALQPSSGTLGIGKKKDLWLVVFNDVILRCQRVGVTTLPLAATINARTNSMPELQGGKTKYATTGRRSAQAKPRNMYKFIQIEARDERKAEEFAASLEDIARARGTQSQLTVREEDEDDISSDDSDRKSKMSFSYWGADKITVQAPGASSKTRVKPASGRGRRTATPSATMFGRESSANAKFGTRLISEDSPAKLAAGRPASRRTGPTPTNTNRKGSGQTDESTISKATNIRPTWDSSTRTPVTSPIPGSSRRPRANSQSTATQVGATPSVKVASIAPSDDSGVGMYRQMMAQNPSFDNDS